MYRRAPFCILLLFALMAAGCSPGKEPVDEITDGLRKDYYSNGALFREAYYKDGLLHGLSKEYYDNGVLFQEVMYEKNLMHGVLKRFYKSGVMSQETPYKNGVIHGVQKRFRRSGQLMCEVPYHEGQVCAGLREYSIDSSLKKLYPEIKITHEDRMLLDEVYILRIGLSDDSKGGVEYYFGKLTDGKYIGKDAVRIRGVEEGVAELYYDMPPGSFKMEQLSIIAKVKTSQDNYYITQRNYNLAIENRF